MAAKSTLPFLPSIFQTDSNKKFLNATLDQLVSNADLQKVNGYIGRKFAPTYKANDNYVTEPTPFRKNYQLEPSVVVQNKSTNTVSLFSGYVDLLNQLDVLGANTKDHSRLFSNESYTYGGLFDFDKFSNYNNYYWLPEGPDAVDVFSGNIPTDETFSVTRNTGVSGYNFTGHGVGANPVLTLARGGTYKFNLSQTGNKFWIQTEPGVSGTKATQTNVSTRNIFGVQNNGASIGQIVFNVPTRSAQNAIDLMPLAASADYAVTMSYTQVQHSMLSVLLAEHPDVFDGQLTNLDRKTIVFVGDYADEANWESPGNFGNSGGFDSDIFDGGQTVPQALRLGTWVIVLEPLEGDYLVTLQPYETVEQNNRVFVKSGVTYGATTFYVDYTNSYKVVPTNTAILDRLYYQDASNPGMVGIIQLVDENTNVITIEQDVIGQKNYTSPNGVIFTNGLKIQFDDNVSNPDYANKEFYVEGVGTSIQLVPVESLITPEAYAEGGIDAQDYVTINRYSLDANPWSRSNRWFHIDVINATAAYNNTTPLPNQSQRATRPIIEFESCLQLFNYGRVAKGLVDQLDYTITDAMNEVENVVIGQNASVEIGDLVLTPGQRVIFANDVDPVIRDKIYVVTAIDATGPSISGQTDTVLHLVLASDAEIDEGHSITVLSGANGGKSFWFDGSVWALAQQKTSVNQSPLFDVIDSNGHSISDNAYYATSTFAGTAIFSYKVGAGTNDSILGFPLSYRNFNSIGDIQFTNNFDTDVATYSDGQTSINLPINNNFVKQNTGYNSFVYRNTWVKNVEPTKQYQVFSFVYTGQSNYFPIDVAPEDDATVPYTKVYLNNTLLNGYTPSDSTTDNALFESGLLDYQYFTVGARPTIRINVNKLSVDDKVDILIYSKTVSKTGYYEIPNNLDYNSKNSDFESLTLGQLRNHIKTIVENTKAITSPGASGVVPALRDMVYKNNGGSIVQQSAPVMYSNIFLTDHNMNFVKSLELAGREYNRFKNKFLELATTLDSVNPKDIPGSVDTIIKSINTVKNKTFPWYYSDMIPYGDNANVITYKIINPYQYQYEISQVFNDLELSNLAVLVYLDGQQLVNGVDFTFPQDRSAIILNKDVITLTVNSVLKVIEYNNTDGCFVPETPSKLGLYPKFVPGKFVDTSYLSPVEVIRGHDGSTIPAFGDIRDDLLLELENRIYNNIKINYESRLVNIYDHIPGKFRNTDYTLTEFNQLLSQQFLRWVGDNQVDYSSNPNFQSNNAWTWNYKKFKDRLDGEFLPGSWRAIFSYFFDTYRPHSHPWEMLGFGEKPGWWEARYGVAPYTGSNQLLWDDLEAGYVHSGYRAGINKRFARPGLSKIIPVDDYGSLLSPEKWAASTFDSLFANSTFAVGDQGPAEFAWRSSSWYPYAVQFALAMAKPGVYFGSLINVDRYYRNTLVDQLINSETMQRVTLNSVVINGDSTSGTIARSAGYLNWVRDYLLNTGMDPVATIQYYLDTVNIQLGYKVGGYTDKKFIQVLAEQGSPTTSKNSIVLPTENYNVHLNQSTPIRKVVYSAVTVEKTDNGYSVAGYNKNNPYFTIIPSRVNNNYYTIDVLTERATIYKDYESVKVTIPYGYEFNSRQQVVDFLVSYGRYLVSQGFRFRDVDSQLADTRDWVLSSKEFLNWSQQGWASGNFIVLSPVNNVLNNVQPTGVIAPIENSPAGTKVLDQDYNFIKNSDFVEVRTNNTFKITADAGRTICFADFNVVQYEHVIIFDNVTVFNDIIYVPELGNRQFRLKLIGSKTGSWTGAFNPPGFVYNNNNVDSWAPGVDYKMGSIVEFKGQYYTALTNIIASNEFVQSKQWALINKTDIKTGLLPNFSYLADRMRDVYDVDNLPADSTLEGYGTSLIGFRKRDYLANFGLDETSQVKFYQGFIKNKGTMNAITGLTKASLDNLTSDITIFEEWALRVGEYGALNSNNFVELVLDDSKITANPAPIELLDKGDANSELGVVGYRPVDLYRKPNNYSKNIFFNRTELSDTRSDILTAGYVNLTDVDGTLFDFTSYANLDAVVDNIGPGFHIWVAKDFSDDWNVYRVTETKINVLSLSYTIDGLMSVEFNGEPRLEIGDVFAIKRFDEQFDGFYQVFAIDGMRSVKVIPHKNPTILKDTKVISGIGIFYKLQTARVATLDQANALLPLNGWNDGDKIWVDNDTNNKWGVYEKVTAWDHASTIYDDVNQATPDSGFGTSVVTNSTGLNVFVGMPSRNIVKMFAKNSLGELRQVSTLKPSTTDLVGTTSYSEAMSAATTTVAIGAPDSLGGKGLVAIHNVTTGSIQFIWDEDSSTSTKFGSSVATSDDGEWVYVGAPGENKVYVYRLDSTIIQHSETVTWAGGSTYTLPWTPASVFHVRVFDSNYHYVPGVDYTLSGDDIVFVTEPAALDTVAFVQSPSYVRVSSDDIVASSFGASAGDSFGYSLATSKSGNELIIGAPGTNSNAGAAYVMSRFQQRFTSIVENQYICVGDVDSTTKVYVGNTLLVKDTDFTVSGDDDNIISFAIPLSLGQIITVIRTEFSLVQTITEPVSYAAAGNRYGAVIAMDRNTASSFFVGAPNTFIDNSKRGIVYRYANPGKILGTVASPNSIEYVKNLIINEGNGFDNPVGLYINGVHVDLSDALTTFEDDTSGSPVTVEGYLDPQTCVDLINAAQIPNITARVADGVFFEIQTSSITFNNKLNVTSDGSDLFSKLDINVYELSQVITHPASNESAGFVQSMKYDDTTGVLVISSYLDSVGYNTEIDNFTTSFDVNSTVFKDTVNQAGAVYLYEKLVDANTGSTNYGTVSFVNLLKSPNGNPHDQFGFAIDVSGDLIVVGAPEDDSIVTGGGTVHVFSNPGNKSSWNLFRSQTDTVDINNVSRIFTYSNTTKSIMSYLDFIDPVKGKILGIAEQDIDFKTANDPATYNNSSNPLVSSSRAYHWNETQVGKIWWNLDSLRYIDYEQDTLVYRSNNWGKIFPGSTVQVCEWVGSRYLPSQYVENGGDGVPLYPDDTAYVTVPVVNNGNILVKYYYWVTNKQNAAPGKTHSVSVIADIIENPQLQGVPYAFIMKANAFGLVNIQSYLSGTDTVLNVEYNTLTSDSSIHTEYALVNENDPSSVVPDRILEKLIDSLAGVDKLGQVVPDPTLNVADQIGISIRPRQTMFVNQGMAIENFVKYVNNVLIQYPVVLQFSLLGLEAEDPYPAISEYDITVNTYDDLGKIDINLISTGYKVLVLSDSTNVGLWTLYTLNSNNEFETTRVQSFNTNLYWSKVDWYASDYDPTSRINYTVPAYKDIASLAITAGDVIRVNYDEHGLFAIYRVNSDLTLSKVGIQNGTIQLAETLYNWSTGQMGWDEDLFDTIRFDQTPSIEIRNILTALRDDIFVETLSEHFNKMFFVLVNYVLQEQKSVDWIFKTSFISIFHKLRELSQPASFVLDNQDYYLQYINEVKPYRTIVREYVVDYVGKDVVESNVTDFDLPSIYDKKLGKYRTPDGSLTTDALTLSSTGEYQYWNTYRGFTIDSIQLSSNGSGYLFLTDPASDTIISPSVTISGGGGSGATAVITGYNVATGAITEITVTNPGVGYTSAPRVTINGTGGSGALAAARLSNKTVRQFDSVLKFDRTSYDSDVKIWSSTAEYQTGDIVAYSGAAYRATDDIPAAQNFDFNLFELLTGEEVGNTNDRIIAYLASATKQNLDLNSDLGREITETQDTKYWLTQYIGGIEYPGVKVQGLPFNANVSDQQLVDSIIQSRYVDTALGTRPEDINIDGGAYIDYYSSHAPEELLPGVIHDSINISVFTKSVISSGNLTVDPYGSILAYREFFDIHDNHSYYRISGFSTAFLAEDISITDNEIPYLINEGSELPIPDITRAVPGVVFIDGELITFWENDTDNNVLRNVRRGVGGTPIQPHYSNNPLTGTQTPIYDASASQVIPDIQPRSITISTNGDFDSNSSWNYWKTETGSATFVTTDYPTYKLSLSGNIVANVGDVITQEFSNANAVVRGNVTTGNTVAVVYNSGIFTTANANCVIYVNGVQSTLYANAVGLLGSIDSAGNVTISSTGSNVVIRQDKLAWIDYDFRSFGLQFQDSDSLPARKFLGEGATLNTEADLSTYYTIEDEEVSVNTILITENNQILTEE